MAIIRSAICTAFLVGASVGLIVPANAQVAFQPPGCEFRAVFVVAPNVKTATMPDKNGKSQTETIASLGVMLDGKPNFFRAECIDAEVPTSVDEALLQEDMQTIASGNNLRKAVVWVEKSSGGALIGRIRGEFTDSVATYQLEIRRYLGQHNIMDVWVGAPPGVFPSEGNLIFLKELQRDGKPLD